MDPKSDWHEQLLQERGSEYGDSWQQTDRWIKAHLDQLAAAPSPFTLIMLHNKLARALTSPTKEDHYDDIIGYAKLAKRALAPSEATTPAVRHQHWLLGRDEMSI